MAAELKLQIPVLTDAVRRADETPAVADRTATPVFIGRTLASDRESLIAELQTQIAAGAFALTDDIMRTAFAEMEAAVFEQISGRLRRELPELIDALLRERLGDSAYSSGDTDD